MAQAKKVNRADALEVGNTDPASPQKVYVDSSHTREEVLAFDAAGAELVFVSDPGQMIHLDEADVRSLSAGNKLRYNVSADLAAHRDVDRDGFQQRLAIREMRDRRASFEKERLRTPQDMQATRKLQMYGPGRVKTRWVRPDRLEYWKEQGYDIVKADDAEFFAGAPKIENHYEVKTPAGATDLVMVAASQESAKALRDAKIAKANRQLGAIEAGKHELARLGGEPFVEAPKGIAWEDR